MKLKKIDNFATVLIGAMALLASATIAADDAADAEEVGNFSKSCGKAMGNSFHDAL